MFKLEFQAESGQQAAMELKAFIMNLQIGLVIPPNGPKKEAADVRTVPTTDTADKSGDATEEKPAETGTRAKRTDTKSAGKKDKKEPVAEPGGEDDSEEIPLKTCQDKIVEVSENADVDEARKIITSFGVGRVQDIPAEKRQDFMDECDKAIKKAALK